MSFFGRIRAWLAQMMRGRNGIDNLGAWALWAGVIVNLLDSFLGTGILSLLGMVLYVYAIWRIFSRNVYRRAEENRRFVTFTMGISTKVKQFFLRAKNSRVYKYFKCPQCRVLIRLKRGSGEKQITCPKCGCQFSQRA